MIRRPTVTFGAFDADGGPIMSSFTSRSEDIHFIETEQAPAHTSLNHSRTARWLGRTTVALVIGPFVMGIATGVVNSISETQRKQCSDRLTRIGLTLHQYHNAHNHFPAPAIFNSEGSPLLSWRVAILPYLGYQSLYERFHLDEPWDSTHNRALLAEMPREFACPAGPARTTGRTAYQVVVGPTIDSYSVNTPFDGTRGVDMREITDGTAATVLVFEADTPVPWTKPDDLRWSREGPLPRVADNHAGGTHVLLADGGTWFLRSTMRADWLRAILTVNGGEVTSA
jgi:Protein of unknown function (DUF1559)